MRATSRGRASTPPVPGQDAADYLGGVARDAQGGLVLILDNLEEALATRRGRGAEAAAPLVAEMALRVVEEAPRTRLVLSIDDAAFARLDADHATRSAGRRASSARRRR